MSQGKTQFLLRFIKGFVCQTKKFGFCLGGSGDVPKNFNQVMVHFDEFEKFILSMEERDEDLDIEGRTLSEGSCGHSRKKAGGPE